MKKQAGRSKNRGMGSDLEPSSSISYADISKAAGVSPGLVSAFFSGKHYSAERKSGIGISPAKRKKIIDTCHKLNYVPDTPYAFYRLYPEKADVAVLLNGDVGSGFSNPYHSLIFEGIANRAFESEVELSNLFFRDSYDYLIRPEVLPNPILKGAICKIVLTGRPNYALVFRLLKMDVALVSVGPMIPLDGVLSVVPDYRDAAKQAIHVLHEKGHRTIAIANLYLTSDQYNGRMLREGYLEAFRELGLSIDGRYFLDTGGEENADEFIGLFKALDVKPTAIFCLDDNTARIVKRLLEGEGYSIPDDISLLGCNDDRINQEIQPALSTIHLPCCEMGSRAYDELTRIAVEGRPVGHETIVLPVHYVENGTVKAVSV